MAVTFNDDIRRYPNLQQQAQQLAQLFAGGIGSGFQNVAGRDYEMANEGSVGANPYALNPELERILRGAGLYSGSLPAQMQQVGVRNAMGFNTGNDDMRGSYQYVAGSQGEQQPVPDWGTATGYSYRLDGQHPDRSDKTGYYTLTFDPSGALSDLRWDNNEMHGGWFSENMDWVGPMLVGGLALAGAGGLLGGAGLTGGASAAPAAQGGGYFGGLSAGAGGQTGLTLGAGGITGATAPAGFVLAPEIGASLGAAGAGAAAADGYFGGLNPAAGGQGLQMPSAASVEGMGGGQGLVATQAPTVAQTGVLGAGAAPITASQATTVASPFKMALDAVKPYASLIGPATSLIGAATAQMPQMPQNAGARIPGVEAPPEARGLDRQAARSPILDVLGRNRRSNRNPTLLTGPGGVSMESVRVGANTLLGM